MAKFSTYTPATARRVLRDIAELQRRPFPDSLGRGSEFVRGPLVTRWGKTTTNAAYPTYPTSGPAVVVELGDYKASVDPYPGMADGGESFTAYSPQVTVIAVADRLSPLPFVDTIVALWWANGLWRFSHPDIMKAEMDASCTVGGSAAASFYINTVDVGSRTVHYNWMTTGAPTLTSGTEVLVKWFSDEAKWVIIAAECLG